MANSLGATPRFIPPHQQFAFIPDYKPWSQSFSDWQGGELWEQGPAASKDKSSHPRKSKRSSKKGSKYRSKKRKASRKHQFGAYVLQLIGLICLVLAAVKSSEPLTGVGFTLVLIGYNDKSLKSGVLTDILTGSNSRHGNKGDKKRKERKRIKDDNGDSDSDGT